MIKLENITLHMGKKTLLEHANLIIYAQQKVGLIGLNGSGKSTCFALIMQLIQPDAGDVYLPPHLKIGHLEQETPALDTPALEYVIDGDKELRAIEAQLADTEDGELIGELHGRLGSIEGYSAAARAAQLLHGLGFTAEQQAQAIKTFSGGWRVRLNLARTLMSRADILLLDEPTNHLDLDAIVWLEQWLRNYQGTLVLISHDRDFLDAITTHTVHLEQQQLKSYTGNYSSFELQRAEQLSLHQAMYEKQQRQRAHMLAFVTRFKAKASKARQAQSRLKSLARMELIAAAHVDTPFSFQFKTPAPSGDPLLRIDNATLAYEAGNKIILQSIKLNINANARIGLVGPNGAGKSTLIKLLAEQLSPQQGERVTHKNLKLGYFAQHQLDNLDLQASPLLHLQRMDSKASEQRLRDFLGSFDFRGDMALCAVKGFSGGEKTRLALALLIWQEPNLLLLDEPTNHLDLEMREALTIALQGYTGAMLVVSHDRHLLRSTTDELLLVANQQVTEFSGDLEDYQRWLIDYRRQQFQTKATSEKTTQAAAQSRRGLEAKIKKLEMQLDNFSQQLNSLNQQLTDSDLYLPEQQDKLADYLQRQSKITQQLQKTEAEWLELTEKLL